MNGLMLDTTAQGSQEHEHSKETEDMDLDYTNIDSSNRRYSEEELQEIRERYLSKREAQARGRYGRLTSVLEAALALLAESQRGPWGG